MPISSDTQLTTVEANSRYAPSFLEALGSSVKALVPKTRRAIPFSVLGRNNYPALGGDFGGFYGGGSPGSTYDYRAAAGELLENSVVAACVDTVGQALADAPPILEKLVGTEWEVVAGHPVIDLLSFPNKYHNAFEIWSAVAGAEMTTGEAFWRLEWNAARTQPTEIWYERPDSMRVIGTDDEYIAKYIFRRDDGAQFELDNSDVIHFRYALNPWNARRGASPIQAGLRQIAGDNGAATFHGALLRNCAVMSLLVSVKDGQNDNTTPDQLDEFTKKLSQKLRGDNAGAIAGVNLPLDVHKMGYSPDEMALDKLISYYETRICALLRVDPMVVSLGSGTMQKTYANMGEALNDFWERRIMPTKKRHSAVLGAQLLPLFGLDSSVYRISWDYRNVAPLQENEDARHARYREDYRAKVIDLYDAQIGLGMNPDRRMRGVFYGDSAPGDDAAKSLKIYDRNGAWHDRLGLFAPEGYGGGAPHGATSGSGGREPRGSGPDNSTGDDPHSVHSGSGGSSGNRPDARSGSRIISNKNGGIRIGGFGPYDKLHHTWYGNVIPGDSVEVEKAMAAAMERLLPFTSLKRNQEAGIAIRVPEGISGKFALGTTNKIRIPLWKHRNYGTMHTHPRGGIFSPRDIRNFFLRDHEIQKHVTTARCTFSLYKHRDWKELDLSEDEIAADMEKTKWKITEQAFVGGHDLPMDTFRLLMLSRVALKYDLKYRAGIHDLGPDKSEPDDQKFYELD